jgi:hypothetical protein
VLAEIRPHGFQNFRQHRRGGVVIEINSAHVSIVFPARAEGRGQRMVSCEATTVRDGPGGPPYTVLLTLL